LKREFISNLRSDLRFPLNLEKLFNGIEEAGDLARLMTNKDSFVKNKIDCCNLHLDKADPTQLVKQGFIAVTSGEFITKKPFALFDSFQRWGIAIKGPVGFEENVTIAHSVITGPAYISENSRIFDSHLRGTPTGALYIGKNCNVWDYSEVNRSLVGDSSMMHTCNINDSIVGPNSNFGATYAIPFSMKSKKKSVCKDQTKMRQRIVVANYSFGNKIKILDPTTDTVLQIDATHFGILSGTGVSCASGSIFYPGTIVGAGAKIACTIPLTGYIKPDQICSFYFVVKQDERGKKKLQPKGTLAQLMKEHFADTS
jgi:carbonic anhydrase/acetyltransferase-like protein (isoleucine patch superfamily)